MMCKMTKNNIIQKIKLGIQAIANLAIYVTGGYIIGQGIVSFFIALAVLLKGDISDLDQMQIYLSYICIIVLGFTLINVHLSYFYYFLKNVFREEKKE